MNSDSNNWKKLDKQMKESLFERKSMIKKTSNYTY